MSRVSILSTVLIAVTAPLVISVAAPADDEPTRAEVAAFLKRATEFIEREREGAAREISFDPQAFWLAPDELQKAKKLDPRFAKHYLAWMKRTLSETAAPPQDQWDTDDWLMIPEPPAAGGQGESQPAFRIAGRFGSADSRIQKIEFQTFSNRPDITLTIVSDELFDRQITNREDVLKLIGETLNIPRDRRSHLDVKLSSTMLGEDPFVHGKIFDRRHKPADYDHPVLLEKTPPGLPPGKYYKYVPLVPESLREWHSPMDFWIAKGRLCLTFSTIDWKNPARPM